jgi:hypothetical protein
MPAKKITPTGLISSIMALAGFVGLIYAIDDHFESTYVTKAEASDISTTQQQDRVETDIALVELEITYLEDKIAEKDVRQLDPSEIRDAEKRLNYLEQRKLILEKYQLDLKNKAKE